MAPMLEARRRGYLEDQHAPALFALRDLRKDLDLAVGLFGRSTVQTPLTSDARELVADAAAASGDLDITAVIRPYRQVEPLPNVDTPTAWPLAAAGASLATSHEPRAR